MSSHTDHLLYFANRMLYEFMLNRGGFGSAGGHPSPLLVDLLALRISVIEWFVQPILDSDPDATPAAFVEQFSKGIEKFQPLDEVTRASWQKLLTEPLAQEPFGRWMVRGLQPHEIGYGELRQMVAA